MGKILIVILYLASIHLSADEIKTIPLSSIYSPEYISSITPEFIANRPLEVIPFQYNGLNNHIPRVDGETAERLLEYVKADDLYIYDLEKAELSLKAKFGSSVVYELRYNLVYAYQALVAYDVDRVGTIGLAFDVGLEYLKRVKYDSIQGNMDPMLRILYYRVEHTSNRSTVQRLIQVLSEVHPTTTLKFVTNGLNYKTHFKFTHLERLLEEYAKNSKFYHAPDKDALFKVVKRTVDYLYEQNLRSPNAKIRSEIYHLALVAKYVLTDLDGKEAVRYLQTVIDREVEFQQKTVQEAKALEIVLLNSQAETNFRMILNEFIKSDRTSQVLTIPYGNTEIEIAWIRRAINAGQKVVELGQTKTEYLYTIRLVNPGEYAEQAMRLSLELLLLNPYNHGVYYEQEVRVPSKIDLSKVETQLVGKEGIILRPKMAPQCGSLFD